MHFLKGKEQNEWEAGDKMLEKILEDHSKLLSWDCWNTKPILKINTSSNSHNFLKVKKTLSSSVMIKYKVPKNNLTKDV